MKRTLYSTCCRDCDNRVLKELSRDEIYNIYKNFCEKYSFNLLAKDDVKYLSKFCSEFGTNNETILGTSFLPIYSPEATKFLRQYLCKYCMEREQLKQENKKLKLLLVSTNLNKDELVFISKFF